jgi:hypothetical protein
MSKVTAHISMSLSLDGFIAGPNVAVGTGRTGRRCGPRRATAFRGHQLTSPSARATTATRLH